MSTKVLICIPTYNEAKNILEIVRRWDTVLSSYQNIEGEILIIDDNSPDKTADLVANQEISRVSILRRPKKEGLGPAYIAGYTWGLDRGFNLFVESDADGSHQPEEFPRLLDGVNGAQLCLGTRWMPGGAVINWPITRRLISRCGTLYAQKALRLPYKDLTGGYRIISREALEAIDITSITSKGYGFQIEMVMRAHDAGLAITQVPITFIERTAGESKMSRAIVFEALRQTTRWGVQRHINAR